MTQSYPKRLIEVDLPIAELSKLRNRRPADEDVDVRRIGLWWSRKPQNQARAIWLATLIPDPADPNTSQQVRSGLRDVLRMGSFLSSDGEASDMGLRTDLLRFCREVADPTRIVLPKVTQALSLLSRVLDLKSVVALDPFAGGGSIPVEALRLGLTTIANDYNPIACLYLQSLMGRGEIADLNSAVNELVAAVDEVTNDLVELYPEHPEHGRPLGYIRIRQLRCEGLKCGRVVPATSKFELNARDRVGLVFSDPSNPVLNLSVAKHPEGGFPRPTIQAGALTCPVPECGFTTPRTSVMKQWPKDHLPELLAAVVYKKNDQLEICDPTPEQVSALDRVHARLAESSLANYIPVEIWPRTELRRFSPPLYGYTRFSDCHTQRQVLLLSSLCKQLEKRSGTNPTLRVLAALLVAQAVDKHSSFCRWRNDRGGGHENTFAGKSLGMIWDFFEADPLHALNSMQGDLWNLKKCFTSARLLLTGEGTVLNFPAQDLPLPDDSVDVLYTDPPYYDAIPYSHLSDWPFVWMRRVGQFGDKVGLDGLVEKKREVVVDRPHSLSPSTHNGDYFKKEVRLCFERLQTCLKDDGVGVIVFAHQETAAWESLLEGLLSSGFCVTASWPIETERGGRLQAQGTASLRSSIHLVVRSRKANKKHLSNEIGEWRDILGELPRCIHEWLPRLASEGIVGADAIFACLGPALEIFSRYSRVEKASGDVVALREYLEQVWAAVAKEALTQVFKGADATGFEPDARLTAMWLWTLAAPTTSGDYEDTEGEQADDEAEEPKKTPKFKGFKLEFDAARKIAQGLGAVLELMPHLVEIRGDEARLLPVSLRTGHLFGKDQEEPIHTGRKKAAAQMDMFAQLTDAEDAEIVWKENTVQRVGETTLDRVHQAMILFAAGRGEALRRFVVDEGVGNDGKFWRLAQALAALYPTGSDERRWVEGIMARKRQFGF